MTYYAFSFFIAEKVWLVFRRRGGQLKVVLEAGHGEVVQGPGKSHVRKTRVLFLLPFRKSNASLFCSKKKPGAVRPCQGGGGGREHHEPRTGRERSQEERGGQAGGPRFQELMERPTVKKGKRFEIQRDVSSSLFSEILSRSCMTRR